MTSAYLWTGSPPDRPYRCLIYAGQKPAVQGCQLIRAKIATPAGYAAAYERSSRSVLVCPDATLAAAIRQHTRRSVVSRLDERQIQHQAPAPSEASAPVVKQGEPPSIDTVPEQLPRTQESVSGIIGLDSFGRCDVLHIMGAHWWPRGDKMCSGIPPQIFAARKVRGTLEEDSAAIAESRPRVVAIHTLEHQLDVVRTLAATFPQVAFVCIFHGSQNVIARTVTWAPMQRDFLRLSNELSNVWYATPEPTIPWADLGYPRAVVWPNTMPVEPIQELPVIDPPTLLLAGRMDLIKCYPVAILAAGIIKRQRPVRIVTVIQSRDAALDALAELAGLRIEHQRWMEWDAFHGFIRERVSVTICPSLTDSFHYVAWDSMGQGRPAVGSQTTRYLPRKWQVDPNDPRDIAKTVLGILDEYQAASQLAWSIAHDLAERQRAAYIDLICRVHARAETTNQPPASAGRSSDRGSAP